MSDFASFGQLGGPRKKQKMLDASAAALVDLRVELAKKEEQFAQEERCVIFVVSPPTGSTVAPWCIPHVSRRICVRLCPSKRVHESGNVFLLNHEPVMMM